MQIIGGNVQLFVKMSTRIFRIDKISLGKQQVLFASYNRKMNN